MSRLRPRLKGPSWLALALLAGAALFALLPPGTEAGGGTRLRLFYSTDFLGALEPCG